MVAPCSTVGGARSPRERFWAALRTRIKDRRAQSTLRPGFCPCVNVRHAQTDDFQKKAATIARTLYCRLPTALHVLEMDSKWICCRLRTWTLRLRPALTPKTPPLPRG